MRWFLLVMMVGVPSVQARDVLLSTLETEVKREFATLKESSPPVYYMAYRVEDRSRFSASATLGDLYGKDASRTRQADLVLRVGSPRLDNTHELKGGGGFDFSGFTSPEILPLEDDEKVIRRALWDMTQREVGPAIERFQQVAANETVMADAEDQSPDYTLVDPVKDIRPSGDLSFDREKWTERVKKISAVFRDYPDITSSTAAFVAETSTKYYVDSTGSVLRHPITHVRLYVTGETRSEDGMPLFLHTSFDGFAPADLPGETQMIAEARALADKLTRLRTAPAVEPYVGPAILLNKATAVFFHEVMGHRLEGHRQKSEKEGQTFTKKVGEAVLPPYIDVVDDPTVSRFEGKPLLGHYAYDDEGVKARKAVLVDKGVLVGFLMSRSPIEGFPASNGHGRSQLGLSVVARQGNLMIKARETVPYAELRTRLIEECAKQGKPYGLVFADISGGFTTTRRYGPQTFKVIPLEVYRVYTDGRPDELVRGVDIVGTPLAAFSKIMAAGDDDDVFNGFCGAESGSVPVSATAPSILVSEIEVEKKAKDMQKPPVLPSPLKGAKQ